MPPGAAPATPPARTPQPERDPEPQRSAIASASSTATVVAPGPSPSSRAGKVRGRTAKAEAVAAAVAAGAADRPPPDPETVGLRTPPGESLVQPPLPPPPGLGPTRRRLTVPPPSPPFVEADVPFHWKVVLPSAIGRKVTIQVGDGRLELDGTVVPIDQITEVRFKLQVEAALFRRAASARMTVGLGLKDGSNVRVSARNAASQRRATAIIETLAYLWTLLSDTAGADERQLLVQKIDRGAEVNVGRLRLTAIGIAWKRNPIARWSTIGDPYREGLDVVIPTTEGEPIIVPLAADDAYQLPALVPILRNRFG